MLTAEIIESIQDDIRTLELVRTREDAAETLDSIIGGLTELKTEITARPWLRLISGRL